MTILSNQPVAASEISYADETADIDPGHPYSVVHLLGEARGGRYDLYVLSNQRDGFILITLANFGKAISLRLSHYSLSWDYVADKLNLMAVDAQVVTHMINQAFVWLGLSAVAS